MFAIAFPVIDPTLVEIGPISIRWYALAYVVGILIGWWAMRRLAAREGPNGAPIVPPGAVDDFVVWATLGVVLGGRFGYVLFYQPHYYLEHPLAAFALWHGGMSFHGGLVGVVTAIWLFARRRGLSFLTVGDLVTTVTPIGLLLGRMANFVNGELWGRITDVSWGVVFCNDQIRSLHNGTCPAGLQPRHPSQLYEATFEGAVLLAVLLWLVARRDALKRPGLVAGWFLSGYGVARITAEFFREPDVQLGFLFGGATMGQLLSLPVLACGLYLIWQAKRRG
jgi:phosphatidylglycerol:prolipoprotein diacylglycerol transferase